jgi:hypothetical protein
MDKGQYDGYRQGVYNDAVAIVDKHDAYKNAGQLNAQALAYFINELDSIMASFKATTDAQRRTGSFFNPSGTGTIEASWLDPRFNDYYNFFTTIAAGWRRDLAAMPPEVPIDYTQPTPGPGYVMPPEEGQSTGWTLPGVTPAPSSQGPTTGGGVTTTTTFLQPPALLPGITPAPGGEAPPVGSQGPFGGWIGRGGSGGGIVETVSEMSPMMLLAIGLGLYLVLGRRRG